MFTFENRPQLIFIVCIITLIRLFGFSLFGLVSSVIFYQAFTPSIIIIGFINILLYTITIIGIFKMLKWGVFGYATLTIANIILERFMGTPPAIYDLYFNIPTLGIGFYYLKQMK